MYIIGTLLFGELEKYILFAMAVANEYNYNLKYVLCELLQDFYNDIIYLLQR